MLGQWSCHPCNKEVKQESERETAMANLFREMFLIGATSHISHREPNWHQNGELSTCLESAVSAWILGCYSWYQNFDDIFCYRRDGLEIFSIRPTCIPKKSTRDLLVYTSKITLKYFSSQSYWFQLIELTEIYRINRYVWSCCSAKPLHRMKEVWITSTKLRISTAVSNVHILNTQYSNWAHINQRFHSGDSCNLKPTKKKRKLKYDILCNIQNGMRYHRAWHYFVYFHYIAAVLPLYDDKLCHAIWWNKVSYYEHCILTTFNSGDLLLRLGKHSGEESQIFKIWK